MIDDRIFEDLLRRSLDGRGAPAPFPVDVEERVMARVAVLGPAPRREAGFRQLRWWAAAAVLAGLGLTAVLATRAPSSASIASSLADAVDTVLKLAAPLASMAAAAGRVTSALIASVAAVVRPLAPLQPFAHVMLAALSAIMLGYTIVVVGRDVSRRVVE